MSDLPFKVRAADADHLCMDRCSACGATLAAGVTWCGQCYAEVGHATTVTPSAPVATIPTPTTRFGGGTTSPAPGVPGRAVPVEAPKVQLRTTRWGKTPTTFGPMGRSIATIALLIPLALMLIGGLADPFALGGAGVWLVIVMPWALRDIWKAGQVPAT